MTLCPPCHCAYVCALKVCHNYNYIHVVTHTRTCSRLLCRTGGGVTFTDGQDTTWNRGMVVGVVKHAKQCVWNRPIALSVYLCNTQLHCGQHINAKYDQPSLSTHHHIGTQALTLSRWLSLFGSGLHIKVSV